MGELLAGFLEEHSYQKAISYAKVILIESFSQEIIEDGKRYTFPR